MENRPVINLTSRSPAPGADSNTYERYKKWSNDVYTPMAMNVPEALGADVYQIIQENPQYPSRLGIPHFKNLTDLKSWAVSSAMKSVQEEFKLWTERRVTDQIWSAVYALAKSFRARAFTSESGKNTMIENSPVMHLEAYRLSLEEEGEYDKWFMEYGCNIFMPLFLKLPGLSGYDWYEDTGFRMTKDVRELEYPRYISMIYFKDIVAFENFTKSSEMVSFQKALRSVFPRGPKYEWYVQYQLEKSWSK